MVIGAFFGLAVISRSGLLFPSHDFSQNIADCKAMSDVTFIVEGHFRKPRKKLGQFDAVRAESDGSLPPPVPIYELKAEVVHLGFTGVTNNKTGKQMVKSMSYIIREGEAPLDALGKEVLACYNDSKPRKIKSIHVAQ